MDFAAVLQNHTELKTCEYIVAKCQSACQLLLFTAFLRSCYSQESKRQKKVGRDSSRPLKAPQCHWHCDPVAAELREVMRKAIKSDCISATIILVCVLVGDKGVLWTAWRTDADFKLFTCSLGLRLTAFTRIWVLFPAVGLEELTLTQRFALLERGINLFSVCVCVCLYNVCFLVSNVLIQNNRTQNDCVNRTKACLSGR